MQVVTVDNYTFDKATRLSLLVGSGISLWEPSNLPTGQQFSHALLAALFWDEADAQMIELANKVPFENIMDLCPSDRKLEALVRQQYDVYRPNELHATLAKAIAEGYVESVVTTNYDGCLDKALSNQLACPIGLQMGSVRRVVGFDDAEPEGSLGPGCYYFKIHGSTDNRAPGSLIFKLRDEGALLPWKRKLLSSLWRGRVLFIIGYSGLDFEISPVIPLTRPANVTWNVFNAHKMSPNAILVMTAAARTFIKTSLSPADGFSISSHLSTSGGP
ncbi:MAG TPA: SIR2 family protein [Nitrososphaera sp.]|nr:SIR2 family protein [Nitrososphaera sp.]